MLHCFTNRLDTRSPAASQNQPLVAGITVYFIYSTQLQGIIRFSSDDNSYLCAETKHNENSLNGFWKEWDKVTE